MMGARGRVPSGARGPAGRPAWAPLHVPSRVGGRPRPYAVVVVAAVGGRDAFFRATTDRSTSRPNPSSIRSFRRRMHARRGEALRSGHARPERGGASRRGPLALALRACVARWVLPGWESGRAGRTVGSRCAPGGCSCARAGGERCTCTYRGPGSRVAAGRHRRRAVPLCRFSPWPCHVWFSPSLIGFSHAFRAVEWQASAYRSCTGPPGSYLICSGC